MTTSVISGITATEAEQMNMSIRLLSDGLTFILSNSTESQEIISHGHLLLERHYQGEEEAVRELFFAHPELCLPYRSVTFHYAPIYSVLAPEELFAPAEAMHWLSSALGGNKPVLEQLWATHYTLVDEAKVIVSAIDTDLYRFLQRTHLQLYVAPYYAPILEGRKPTSRSHSGVELSVVLRSGGSDCFALRSGETIFLNSFTWVNPSSSEDTLGELTYYISSLWRNLGLNGHTDRLYITYPSDSLVEERTAERLGATLATRIAHIHTEPFGYL